MALKLVRQEELRVQALKRRLIKQAASNGASSYAIGSAVGLSHSQVQRILRGDYDKGESDSGG